MFYLIHKETLECAYFVKCYFKLEHNKNRNRNPLEEFQKKFKVVKLE